MVTNGCRLRSAVFPQCTGQTDPPTDRQTDRPTDRTRESLMTIGRCAPRATRPNNNNNNNNSFILTADYPQLIQQAATHVRVRNVYGLFLLFSDISSQDNVLMWSYVYKYCCVFMLC